MLLFLEFIWAHLCINNKGKHILFLGKGSTQGLNHTLTAKTWYLIKFARPGLKFCLSLHYNASNSFLFDNTTKTYQFKAKDYEKKNPLCLENIEKNKI